MELGETAEKLGLGGLTVFTTMLGTVALSKTNLQLILLSLGLVVEFRELA